MKRWCTALLLALALLVAGRPARAQSGGERVLAIYLPGVYFAQLEMKLELGNELAAFLAQRLGERYRLNARVYGTEDALTADASRIYLALVESPFVATRLQQLLPISVATVNGSSETRLLVLASPSVKSLSDLRKSALTYAAVLDQSQPFFDNFVFEGEMTLPKAALTPTRDVASALSLASLRKADAVMLYEDDAALGRQSGLRPLYQSDLLPRPTLALMDRKSDGADAPRLREALAQFHGKVHPTLRAFRAASEVPYQNLRAHIEHKQRRLPPLLELSEDQSPLPTPHPPGAPAGSTIDKFPSPVPLQAFAPLD
jgi:hypothetical protein